MSAIKSKCFCVVMAALLSVPTVAMSEESRIDLQSAPTFELRSIEDLSDNSALMSDRKIASEIKLELGPEASNSFQEYSLAEYDLYKRLVDQETPVTVGVFQDRNSAAAEMAKHLNDAQKLARLKEILGSDGYLQFISLVNKDIQPNQLADLSIDDESVASTLSVDAAYLEWFEGLGKKTIIVSDRFDCDECATAGAPTSAIWISSILSPNASTRHPEKSGAVPEGLYLTEAELVAVVAICTPILARDAGGGIVAQGAVSVCKKVRKHAN